MNFTTGDRVQLHPATDSWMQGDRYATVLKIGREHVHLRTDHGRYLRVALDNILEIVE